MDPARREAGGQEEAMSLWTLCCAALLCSAPDRIACLRGLDQETRQVCVVEVASKQITVAGPGKRDGAPRWSPDGQRLAFESYADAGLGIYVVRSAGSEGRALKHQCDWNQDPRWSPDGKRLAYTASSDGGLRQMLMVYDLETNTETAWGAGRSAFLRPVWLPGLELLTMLRAGDKSLWKGLDIDALLNEVKSGALVALTVAGDKPPLSLEPVLVTQTQCAPLLPLVTSESARYAEWAIEPDRKGGALAFESNDGGDREIFHLGKRGLVDLTNHAASDWNPVWSPDGRWIAFESFRSGVRGVYRVFADTARVFAISDGNGAGAWSPTWSRDGERVAYVSNTTGLPQVFVTTVDSGRAEALLQDGNAWLAPAWCPK